MVSFIDRAALVEFFAGKSVAIVGSGPGCMDNEPGFVDSHDLVVRVNTYKTGPGPGYRCDVHYSFYGSSIKKTATELQADGVRLVMAKCPDCKFMDSEWHRKNNKTHGVDFRYIYQARKDWWFCPTYIPDRAEFMVSFELLNGHIPSTGFSALLAILPLARSVFLTGFDFFASRIHNVNEPWRPGNPDDPIGHAPELERAWLLNNIERVTVDKRLSEILA